MQVFHLGHTKFARLLNGEGAKLHGGRWNKIGTPCIYTSESKALCVLEYAANVRLQEMPASLSITVFELPPKSWLEIDSNDLPKSWQQVPTPEATKLFGTELLKKTDYVAVKVPSAIIPTEYNYLLNPLAMHFERVTIIEVHSFSFDKRIKN